jgi:hypothetical protein
MTERSLPHIPDLIVLMRTQSSPMMTGTGTSFNETHDRGDTVIDLKREPIVRVARYFGTLNVNWIAFIRTYLFRLA